MDACKWLAIQTRVGKESVAAAALESRGYDVFLPTYTAHDGRTRASGSQRPLFAGYLFCCCNRSVSGKIVTSPGVLRIVSSGNRPVPVSEDELTNVRTIVTSGLLRQPWQYVSVGCRVRIDDGPLRGVEGVIAVADPGAPRRLIVSIELLQRSTAVVFDSSTPFTVVCSQTPNFDGLRRTG
jgi:transcription antitermination factor NusG